MSEKYYACGKCKIPRPQFVAAKQCCNADHVLCPLEDLPQDAIIGHGMQYNYGKAFTGNWELVHNHGVPTDPMRVYPLPALVAKAMESMFRDRFEEGRDSAQQQMRVALGMSGCKLHA